MLSTVIDDKPASSTWLNRLRLNRGLSTTDDDDASGNPLTLDDFLRRNHDTEITGDPTSSSASDSAPTPSDPLEEPSGTGEWYGVMSDVLSELFNFGGSSQSSAISGKKKLPRKQSNPKHCSVETPNNVLPQNANRLPSSSYNKKPAAAASASETTRERRRSVVEGEGVEEEEEEKDLVGFSRSEVTVIDTSFKIWKTEKLVFRRRNVWKVRDKKGKSRVVSSKMKMKMKMKMKKRKCEVGDGEIAARKSKKMKISTSVSDNIPRYQIEKVHDEPESSNVNPRLSSKPRKESSLGIHSSKKNSKTEALGHHRSLAY